jgi:transposase InsO family protein
VSSRYAWNIPLKDKTGSSVSAALKSLFRHVKPITLQSGKGTEFVNTTFHRYLKSHGVSFHTTHNLDIKSAIIERYNQSLKTRMYKYFTKKITLTVTWM